MFVPTIVSLLLLSASATVRATPCVAFDVNWNLLAFGLDGKDWFAGTQDTWTTGQATDITATGRPPFDGANTTCYLSQYANAIYVLNGDSKNPSSVYIYDAAAKSWSAQAVTVGTFDTASFDAILDHDTNVFYGLSHGNLFSLDMGLLKAANSTPLSWVNDEQAPYPSSYQPVMALAQNHIHFLNVPGVPAGSADIFVIHYSYFQPQPQAYPLPSGGAFPAMFGQTASFFQQDNTVQQMFAFIPQDSSATYIINVETNTTQSLAAPMIKDPKATYFAGNSSLVQVSSNGTVSYLLYQDGNTSANGAATWSIVKSLTTAAPPSASSAASPTTSGSGSGKGSSPTGTSGKGNGALTSSTVQIGVVLATVMGVVASLL